MKWNFRSLVSLMVAVALLFTLIPLKPAAAAESAGASFFHFDNLSSSSSNPTEENRSTIQVDGTFNGVLPNTISYVVQRLEDDPTTGEGMKPVIDEASNAFHLLSVKLNQGVNKITISGTTTLGDKVSISGYVKFTDVPAIFEVSLGDGTKLEEGSSLPTVVSTQSITVFVKAANGSKGVKINGESMFSGGTDSYYLPSIMLEEGVNNLTIVVTSDTKEQVITRQVVYHPAAGVTVVNPKFAGQDIGKSAVVYSNSGIFTGKVILDKSLENKVILKGTVYRSGASTSEKRLSITLSNGVNIGNNMMYDFTTENTSLDVSGPYIFNVKMYNKDTDGLLNDSPDFTFTYRNVNDPVINEVYQLYNVDELDKNVTYDSKSVFPSGNDTTITQLPIYLMVETTKGNNVKIFTESGTTSTPVTSDEFTDDVTGNKVFKITSLPTGSQKLNIVLYSASGDISDTRVIPLTFLSAPYIEVNELYNNKVYNDASLLEVITGQIVNFKASTLTLDVNGNKDNITVNGNTFTYENNTSNKRVLKLVPGPNVIKVTGTANGTPVKTQFTVLYFSDERPVITELKPFKTGTADNPDNSFFTETDKFAYTTSEKNMGLIVDIENTDEVILNLSHPNAGVFAAFTRDSTGWGLRSGSLQTSIPAGEESKYYLIQPRGDGVRIIIHNIELPKSGLQAITVGARIKTVTVSQTLEITRELPVAQLLSPKLPQESVVKQNFINVSILAEGADQVLIGKNAMVKSSQPGSSIFRLEVKNLKAGKNTIKYTIINGKQKINDQFIVTYIDETTEGAQYKAPLSKSGKLSVFKGEMVLNLPKGTVLQQTKAEYNTEVPTINLFNERDLLFGIASPIDGRTIKTYNRVGEVIDGIEMDGTLGRISSNNESAGMLQPVFHYGLSSQVYWVDAGAFQSNLDLTKYELSPAVQPYELGREFYNRNLPSAWLETSQSGTITLKYDSKLVNAASSNLGIWWYNPTNKVWTPVGGKVDSNKKTVTAPFYGFGYYSVMSLRYSYNDVISHKTARSDIEMMLSRGIMKAAKNDAFGVYEPMTRGEFATIMVRALNIPLDYDEDPNKLTFDDVRDIPNQMWDYRYIETAVRKGIIRGTGPRVFLPNNPLSREEAANIIARAMDLKLGDIAKDKEKLQKQFTDANTIASNYSFPAVLAVTKAGIITGIPNSLQAGEKKQTYRFAPADELNRADTAIIVKRIMTKLKAL